MAKKKTVQVEGKEISFFEEASVEFISLTDIAKESSDEPRFLIRNWLSTQNTISYLGAWESLYNENFNRAGFRTVRDEFFERPFSLTPSRWIDLTGATGIISKGGKEGGTFAHKDIALNFCYWISPVFQIYLIKEFQRLKDEEAKRLELDWNLKRQLAKVNYRIHSTAIKENLIPPKLFNLTKKEGFVYASEADLLNMALFGMTAKLWRLQNPELKGNIRDYATNEQLLVLANLESHNSHFIKEKLSQDERLKKLNEIAIYQMQILVDMPSINQLSGKIKDSGDKLEE
jgi:hypothetical protein